MFLKYSSELGILEVEMDAKFLINDGQHRKAAIVEALKEDASLGEETISIVFYADKGLERSQQIFTDLNKNAIKTSNSISELYDSRDQIAVITRNVIKKIEFLNAYTDKEKDILGKFSSSLFTLNTFYTANKTILGNKVDEKSEGFIFEFWFLVTNHMAPWADLMRKEVTKKDLREKYIATQGIVIQAFGRIGAFFYQNPEINMKVSLQGLKSIDWSRDVSIWHMRAINQNGRIITNKRAATLIGNVIKGAIGLPLSPDEAFAENQLQNTVRL